MDGIKLLFVLVLALGLGVERSYSQQPSNFRLLTGSESRELELEQNPELLDVLARTGERVLINITGEESTAILQEGVNALSQSEDTLATIYRCTLPFLVGMSDQNLKFATDYW